MVFKSYNQPEIWGEYLQNVRRLDRCTTDIFNGSFEFSEISEFGRGILRRVNTSHIYRGVGGFVLIFSALYFKIAVVKLIFRLLYHI